MLHLHGIMMKRQVQPALLEYEEHAPRYTSVWICHVQVLTESLVLESRSPHMACFPEPFSCLQAVTVLLHLLMTGSAYAAHWRMVGGVC